eukprot:scaffold5350_cov127-Skeletonema_menzelii.AAC.1
MSKEFVQSFFPFITSYVSSERAPIVILHAWNFIFPDTCKHHHEAALSPLQIQRPCLAMAAVLGAFIGIKYGRGIKNCNQKHDDLISLINESWSKSSTLFGCMNISALVHHCIFPSNVSWALDCAFTGVSSLHLFTTSILLWILWIENVMEEKTIEIIERHIRIIEGAAKVVVAITIHTAMSVLGDSRVEISVAGASNAVELFYFVPLFMSICVLFPITIIGVIYKNSNSSCRGPLISLLGGALIIATTLLGESICQFVSDYLPSINDSSLLYDCYHLPTIVFLGCDISFYGFGIWSKDLTAKKR